MLEVHLLDHRECSAIPFRLSLREEPEWVILAAVKSDAEALGQAATHAPHPMQAAASHAICAGLRNENRVRILRPRWDVMNHRPE